MRGTKAHQGLKLAELQEAIIYLAVEIVVGDGNKFFRFIAVMVSYQVRSHPSGTSQVTIQWLWQVGYGHLGRSMKKLWLEAKRRSEQGACALIRR